VAIGMARIGELLVEAGLLTSERLEQALRAQVMWGGRLGTNLIELGFIDLDPLAQALGRQHRLPAALGRHFEKVDRDLQRLLSPDVADRFCVVPLLRVGPARKVVIVSIAPLGRKSLVIIAEELAVEPSHLIPAIAPELRIRYQLERIYKIPRNARFMRSPGKTVPPFPTFENIPEVPLTDPQIQRVDIELPTSTRELAIYQQASDTAPAAAPAPTLPPPFLGEDDGEDDLQVESGAQGLLVIEVTQEAPSQPTEERSEVVGDLDELSALEDGLAVPSEVEETPSGRERRKYVRTIADTPPSDSERQALGRIAIRRVAVATNGHPAGVTLDEATRAIRRAQDRDLVAELVIDALCRFAPACEAALLLVVRGGVAVGWKGFARSGAAPPEIAVPMKTPGLVPSVVACNCTVRSPSTELGPIDQLLLVSLGHQIGELVVVPVAIAGTVMCAIAMVTGEDAPIATAESIAGAAGAAVARHNPHATRKPPLAALRARVDREMRGLTPRRSPARTAGCRAPRGSPAVSWRRGCHRRAGSPGWCRGGCPSAPPTCP
jgi:hypothetical protein